LPGGGQDVPSPPNEKERRRLLVGKDDVDAKEENQAC
tara:strand:+ start:527 stop:637 length:111 start_codon:yes stop_codon:yes gene_type:complete